MRDLVFLHGWLGDPIDFEPVSKIISFPGKKILAGITTPFSAENPILIGYSMGGRYALELHKKFPDLFPDVIVIGAHPGLKTEKERDSRQRWESIINEKLQSMSPEDFLQEWYATPLFQHLEVFHELHARRISKISEARATFNALLLSERDKVTTSAYFLVGKKDLKYRDIYDKSIDHHRIFHIENAGHAAHIENPKECAKVIETVLMEIENASSQRKNRQVDKHWQLQ